ncbi:MAG: YdeI/OmpD-associated family protein [Psychroserpens sp.]|uniref:YdeI/OmpD-associated family protein n=1 Tax=Psychroserpens sp. TaxID=2020870 RepID=UPI003C70F85D
MQKSKVFTIGLLDKYHLYIPAEIVEQFPEEKRGRFKIKCMHQSQSIVIYAALRKDKNRGDYRMMFSNANQKTLGLFLNDYFELQLIEDTSKYGVDMPEELEEVFKFDPEAKVIFESQTAGKKRSIIYVIKRTKSIQSRVDKALLLCNNLKRGITDQKLLFKS